MKKIGKSIYAIIAGFIVVAALSIVVDMILEGIGFFPSQMHPELYAWWMLAIALVYRVLFTILGGYITARLAPSHGVRHAVILGILGMAVAALGTAANWDKGAHWYPVLLTLASVPSTWLGGKLQAKK